MSKPGTKLSSKLERFTSIAKKRQRDRELAEQARLIERNKQYAQIECDHGDLIEWLYDMIYTCFQNGKYSFTILNQNVYRSTSSMDYYKVSHYGTFLNKYYEDDILKDQDPRYSGQLLKLLRDPVFRQYLVENFKMSGLHVSDDDDYFRVTV